MLKTKREILLWYIANTTFRLSEVILRSISLSISIRGHPYNNQQFILPMISEKIIVSELTFVSTQLFFSLD